MSLILFEFNKKFISCLADLISKSASIPINPADAISSARQLQNIQAWNFNCRFLLYFHHPVLSEF